MAALAGEIYLAWQTKAWQVYALTGIGMVVMGIFVIPFGKS